MWRRGDEKRARVRGNARMCASPRRCRHSVTQIPSLVPLLLVSPLLAAACTPHVRKVEERRRVWTGGVCAPRGLNSGQSGGATRGGVFGSACARRRSTRRVCCTRGICTGSAKCLGAVRLRRDKHMGGRRGRGAKCEVRRRNGARVEGRRGGGGGGVRRAIWAARRPGAACRKVARGSMKVWNEERIRKRQEVWTGGDEARGRLRTVLGRSHALRGGVAGRVVVHQVITELG